MDLRRQTIEGGGGLNALVGTVLGGRYRIQSTLGVGGMAVVYKAEDAILGRTVALKTLHERYAEETPFRKRFKQEARAMASLDHENIVKVYDISQDGDAPFIVAECIGGKDIGDLLSENKGGSLNEQFTRRVAEQLLRALSYAHRRGIIHRDIKPSNILITAEGTVKVADFGIARIVEEENPESGEAGEIVGSARYMAPEQLMGKEATPQSDIYSVGIMLYHCLTGEPPFSGNVKSLAQQHLKKQPTPPRKFNKRISRSMEAVVLKALAKDPEQRYRSADDMLDDIEAATPVRKVVGNKVVATTETRKNAASNETRRGGLGRLVLVPLLALMLLGGGSAMAASSLGYLDLPSRQSVEQALGRAVPVAAEEPPAAPKRSVAEAKQVSVKPEQIKASDTAKEMVLVADVRTYFDYSAREILVNDGFDVRIVYAYQTGYANRGVAWGTDPAIGTMAPKGSTIIVYATPKDVYQPKIES